MTKCRIDPSLAAAHHYSGDTTPRRAYAWELRLQDEFSPDFPLDEPDSDPHRTAFLAAHPETPRSSHAMIEDVCSESAWCRR